MTFINLFANSGIVRQTPFAERLKRARRLIAEADHILIGAGAGLTTAAGIEYGGDDFKKEFHPWIERYGFTDLYSSGFYPFATEEKKWAYWARHIWFSRYRVGGLPLYEELLRLVSGKDYFVITTNVDGQFLKAGFDRQRLFYTQGDYAYFQDATGEDRHLYYNEAKVRQMIGHTGDDLRIPTAMIPRDPVNGHRMEVNLRCDDTFVEDDNWQEMCARYRDFVSKAKQGKLVLLEFGIGFNTPGIIRFPFEQMAEQFPNTALIRFNKDYPQLSAGQPKQYICFQETLNTLLIRCMGNDRQGCTHDGATSEEVSCGY